MRILEIYLFRNFWIHQITFNPFNPINHRGSYFVGMLFLLKADKGDKTPENIAHGNRYRFK